MERGNHAPQEGKSEEEKRESRAERGMRERKGAIMPRRQGKVKRKRGKTEPSGAWRVKRGKHAPRAGKSEEEKRESRAERGMRE